MKMSSHSKPELSSRRLPSFFKVMFGDFYDHLMKMSSHSKPELSSRRLPSFFKVMFGDFYDHLSIPAAFVNLFDGELPREFELRTGDGRERRVIVTNVEKKVFLGKGWNDFVRENSLELGDFVVFHHAGESKFNVKIFEKSGCSREVRRRVNTRAKGSNVIDVDFNYCTVDELGSGTSSRHDPSESKGQPFQDVINEFQRTARLVEAANKFKSKLPCTSDEPDIGMPITLDSSESEEDVMEEIPSKARAVEAAANFTSELPFFKVVLTPSYIHSSYLRIPIVFYRRYMKKAWKIIKLQVSERSWKVKVMIYEKDHVRFVSGWPAFVKANTLQEGDVCVFELREGKETAMIVTIFRASG